VFEDVKGPSLDERKSLLLLSCEVDGHDLRPFTRDVRIVQYLNRSGNFVDITNGFEVEENNKFFLDTGAVGVCNMYYRDMNRFKDAHRDATDAMNQYENGSELVTSAYFKFKFLPITENDDWNLKSVEPMLNCRGNVFGVGSFWFFGKHSFEYLFNNDGANQAQFT
jgi:hypothetical protein